MATTEQTDDAPPAAPFAGFEGVADAAALEQWGRSTALLQQMWLGFAGEKAGTVDQSLARLVDPARWLPMLGEWSKLVPLSNPETQRRLWGDTLAMWTGVLGSFGVGPDGKPVEETPALPRSDRRFADPKWRETPLFALIHQTYLLAAEKMAELAEEVEGLSPDRKEQLRFLTRVMTEALSPANFAMTNPLVLERTLATQGSNLVRGTEHLLADLRKGQLTHTDPEAFEVGRNIATTPGKVVFETRLFQLIQYSPTTEQVHETPLVIFPPWINRFYILDLNPAKSFVRWAVEQGVTVFMVSWKSADASIADVTWDDYVLGQIAAIDHVRERLGVAAVHAIGYCVAGTTLAATLALLARRGEAAKVASATFFTAQVDFSRAGELKNFVDDAQIAMLDALAPEGVLDGRYMAMTFNALRGPDLIWQYVQKNYLMGEDYPAFDLLHWNGDTTNLPFVWQKGYLTDLYRDNRLVVPDAMVVDGTPIDLRLIETPVYIQAGREDHIAPADSVWEMTRHLAGPWTFVLAGSGHIAGVVNPPAANKYQYWLNDGAPASLDDFVAGAREVKGSWWPHWAAWLDEQAPAKVKAKGKRVPGSKGDSVIEDAPGRYVRAR